MANFEKSQLVNSGNYKSDMVVNCQVGKVFPVHLFLCGYAVRYIPGHMPDQNLE
jgi:hypothetical protein